MRQTKEDLQRVNEAQKALLDKIVAFVPSTTDTVQTVLDQIRDIAMTDIETKGQDDARAQIVAQIVALIETRPMVLFETAETIATFLNEAGLKTLRNFTWTGASVRGVIDDVRAEFAKRMANPGAAIAPAPAPAVVVPEPKIVQPGAIGEAVAAHRVSTADIVDLDTMMPANDMLDDIVGLEDELLKGLGA